MYIRKLKKGEGLRNEKTPCRLSGRGSLYFNTL
jgi:hypothetical protein